MDHIAQQEKNNAALTSVIAAIFLTVIKVVVGIMTGSLGILSEAAHSILDFAAAAMTWFAVRVSSRPPDREHHFGHGKIENLSALFETVLLLVTCVWIIYEAVSRLFFKDVDVEASLWGFLVMGLSVVINMSRARVLARTAKKYDSQALEADALHFTTDVWSSWVVIGGLVLVRLADWLNLPWLVKADAIAALIVAGIVIWVSVELGKRTLDGLLDAAPRGVSQQIEEIVRALPGVESVSDVRVRKAGAELFADVTISVARSIPVDASHTVATAIQDAVRTVIRNSDVMVRIVPHDDIASDMLRQVHLVATNMRLEVHNVEVQQLENGTNVALDLEVDENLKLGEAHALASTLERHIRDAMPQVTRIDTHMEPRPQEAATGVDVTAESTDIVASVKQAIAGLPLLTGVHNVIVTRTNSHLDVAVHCTFDPTCSIRDVHDISSRLQDSVKQAVPGVERVIVHPEPEGYQTRRPEVN